MNKLVIFCRANFLVIILFLLCLIIPLQKWLLLLPPAILKFTILDAFLLLMFYFFLFIYIKKRSSLLKKNKKQLQQQILNQLILIIVFSFGLFTGIIASSPIAQTKEAAAAQKEKLEFAAESGYNLCCNQASENKISEASVNDFIRNIYPSDNLSQETAKQVYQEFKKNPQNPDKKALIDKLLPTVPILYLEWTCNNFGCGYGDAQLVWTVSANNRNLGGLITLMSLVLILITAQKTFKYIQKTMDAQKPHG